MSGILIVTFRPQCTWVFKVGLRIVVEGVVEAGHKKELGFSGVNASRSLICETRSFYLPSNSVGVNQSFPNVIVAFSSRETLTLFSSMSTTFHHGGGSSSSLVEGTVLKVSSKTTWNCGEMRPVLKFRIKGISLECNLLKPTNIPRFGRGSQRVIFISAWNLGSNTYPIYTNTSMYGVEWWSQGIHLSVLSLDYLGDGCTNTQHNRWS